jgi:hypoxanthine-guanine phosphoribosyltransferase
VVWGLENYCKEANRQLADVLVYENVSEEGNTLAKVSEIVRNTLENLKGKGLLAKRILII